MSCYCQFILIDKQRLCKNSINIKKKISTKSYSNIIAQIINIVQFIKNILKVHRINMPLQ